VSMMHQAWSWTNVVVVVVVGMVAWGKKLDE
jgi:hypothetical protein